MKEEIKKLRSQISRQEKRHQKHLARQTIPKYEVSSEELLRYTWEQETRHARWSYRLEGTHYGRPWSCHLTRSGAHKLALLILESL